MSIKRWVDTHPKVKGALLQLIFRRPPYNSRVRWFIWIWLTLPKYLKRGISWRSRLDLVPFNRFLFGKNSRIEINTVVNNGMGDIIIANEVHTGIGCVLIGPLTLHKHVGLAQYVRIIGMHHGIDVHTPHHHQPSTKAPVILEEDAFVGTGTVIMGKKDGLPLVIGKYSRIGANSVVTTDIPPYSIAVGNPARVIKKWNEASQQWERMKD